MKILCADQEYVTSMYFFSYPLKSDAGLKPNAVCSWLHSQFFSSSIEAFPSA